MTALLKPIFRPESDSREALLAQCRKSKVEMEGAIWAHFEDAMAFKGSGAWKQEYSSWKACCEANKESLYADSFYRTIASSKPLADILETLLGDLPSEGFARKLRGKLWEVIPEDERSTPLLLSTLAICYAYDDKPMPDKHVIAEALEIVREERDSNSLSFNGETVNVKELAQKMRIKERVLETITAHSKPSKKLLIQANPPVLAILRAYLPDNALPPEGTDLWVSWKLNEGSQ